MSLVVVVFVIVVAVSFHRRLHITLGMEANTEWINSTKVASSLMLLLFVQTLYKDKAIVSTAPGSSTCDARALSPASFLTGFPSDHHEVL